MQDVNPLGKHMHGFTSKGWHFIFLQQCSHAQESHASLLSLIWLKGIVEQTMCRGAQIYTDVHILLYQNTFYHVSDFWPWKAMVLIVVAWCWSIKILDDWIIILWTSDPFCVTLEVHREACLRIKILDKLYWIVLLNQEPVFLNHGHCGIHLIDLCILCSA